jgi:Immunity protein family (Imm11)
LTSASSAARFPGFSRTYVVHSGPGDDALRASLEIKESPFALLRGEVARNAPIRGTWAMGSATLGDVVRANSVVPILLSERAVGVLREHNFTGWNLLPVELTDPSGALLPTYYFLRVPGRCGPIDHTKSVKFDVQRPGGVFPRWRGLYFDPATWDGSHIFMSSDRLGWVFVVEEVKRALETTNVTNTRFVPLDQMERSKP